MVAVAQLVESRIVIPVVVGSSPISHPKKSYYFIFLVQFFHFNMNTENAKPSDEIICPCSGTTKGKIQALIAQGFDADTISRKTGAISGCGGCEWDIAELINEFAELPTKTSE